MDEDSSNKLIPPPNSSVSVDISAEETRRRYINHEAFIRSISALYFLIAFLFVIIGIGNIVSAKGNALGAEIAKSGCAIGIGIFCFLVGWGFLKLKSWVRIPGGILSVLGLFGFPVGTIIHACILYLILGKKGFMVFSSEYRQVIAATPHIKSGISVVWAIFGFLIALIASIYLIVLLFITG
jgi:hypothetical protein